MCVCLLAWDQLEITLLSKNINNNNTLFKHIYAHKQDTRYVFEKADHEVIPIKGPLTKL